MAIDISKKKQPETKETSPKIKSRSFWHSFRQKKSGLLGAFMLFIAVAMALSADWIAPYDPYKSYDISASDIMVSPTLEHFFGTDDSGKDVASLVIYGARTSLLVGFSASIIIIVLGCIIGGTAGYVGGRTDVILMRFTDAILVIPALPLMLVVIAVTGRSLINIILIIGLLSWSYMARLVRASVLSVKERQFVMRARALGIRDLNIVFVHILPQVLPVIFAEATLDVSFAILEEASLSFLGLGDPTLVSWGNMLSRAFMRGAVSSGAWWYLFPPGIALAWVTLSLVLVSNAVQEIVNPRLKTHHLFDERKILSIRHFISSKDTPDR